MARLEAFFERANDARPALTEPVLWEWSAPPGWEIAGSGPVAELRAPPWLGPDAEILLHVRDAAGFSMTARARARMMAEVPVRLLGRVTSAPNPVAPGGHVVVSIEPPPAPGVEVHWQAPEGWSLVFLEGRSKARLQAPATAGATGTLYVTARRDGAREQLAVPLGVGSLAR